MYERERERPVNESALISEVSDEVVNTPVQFMTSKNCAVFGDTVLQI